jgi:hypothetical protein
MFQTTNQVLMLKWGYVMGYITKALAVRRRPSTPPSAPRWRHRPARKTPDVFTDINGLFMVNMGSQWLIISS